MGIADEGDGGVEMVEKRPRESSGQVVRRYMNCGECKLGFRYLGYRERPPSGGLVRAM